MTKASLAPPPPPASPSASLPGRSPRPWPSASPAAIGDSGARTYAYYENPADPPTPSAGGTSACPPAPTPPAADLVSVFTASQTAKLPVTGSAALYWDVTRRPRAWSVYQLILEPEQLHTSVITTGLRGRRQRLRHHGRDLPEPLGQLRRSATPPR